MKFKPILPFDEEIYEYIGSANSLIFHSLAGITFPDPTYEMKRQKANMYSIEYVYEGEGTITENNRTYHITAGDFYILHPNTFHHYYSNKKNPWKKIFFTVDPNTSFIDTIFKLYNIENIIYLPQVYHPYRLEEILELYKNDDSKIHRQLEQIVFRLAGEISDAKQKLNYDSSNISKAKHFIDKRITTKIAISDICDYVNLNQSYFARLFKKTYGMTATEYILQTKVEQSKSLLHETDLPIHAIAQHFSFTDSAHYVRSFSRFVGISPTQYRIQSRANHQ